MPLKNSQYDQIMREYSRRRFSHIHEQEQRLADIYHSCPRLEEVTASLQSAAAGLARARLLNRPEEIERQKNRLDSLRAEKKALLAGLGLTPDDLEVHYTCPDCKDTGYIGSQKCHCFRQAGIDLLYSQSHLQHILQAENFQTFSLDYYSPEPNPMLGGKSNREYMAEVAGLCRRYAESFRPGCGNLLFTGTTGVGKTFLTNCIAKEVLDRSYSVMSISAVELFDRLTGNDPDDEESPDSRYIMDCDLLIIDDLGTELVNSFTASQLFRCINDRLLNRRCTIISTNIKVNELRTVYSERIASLLLSSYRIFQLYGDDIRILKKFRTKAGKP